MVSRLLKEGRREIDARAPIVSVTVVRRFTRRLTTPTVRYWTWSFGRLVPLFDPTTYLQR